MIDTIYFTLPCQYIDKANYINHLKTILTNVKTIESETSIEFQGYLNNLYIKYNNVKGLSIQNSIAKFKYGNNLQTLNYNDLINTVSVLRKTLDIPIEYSKVTRLDIAENIVTDHQPTLYCQFLESAKHFQRDARDGNAQFTNCNRHFVFYDKWKENKHKTKNEILGPRQVLRYEYRLKNHQTIAGCLGLKKVTLQDVIDRYQMLIDAWFTNYQSIRKKKSVTVFKPEVFLAPRAFEKMLQVEGIKHLGGIEAIERMIVNAKATNYFTYKNGSSNKLKKVRDLMALPAFTDQCSLVEELNKKVNLIYFEASSGYYDECLKVNDIHPLESVA
jgi:hypothetical protein